MSTGMERRTNLIFKAHEFINKIDLRQIDRANDQLQAAADQDRGFGNAPDNDEDRRYEAWAALESPEP